MFCKLKSGKSSELKDGILIFNDEEMIISSFDSAPVEIWSLNVHAFLYGSITIPVSFLTSINSKIMVYNGFLIRTGSRTQSASSCNAVFNQDGIDVSCEILPLDSKDNTKNCKLLINALEHTRHIPSLKIKNDIMEVLVGNESQNLPNRGTPVCSWVASLALLQAQLTNGFFKMCCINLKDGLEILQNHPIIKYPRHSADRCWFYGWFISCRPKHLKEWLRDLEDKNPYSIDDISSNSPLIEGFYAFFLTDVRDDTCKVHFLDQMYEGNTISMDAHITKSGNTLMTRIYVTVFVSGREQKINSMSADELNGSNIAGRMLVLPDCPEVRSGCYGVVRTGKSLEERSSIQNILGDVSKDTEDFLMMQAKQDLASFSSFPSLISESSD